VLDVVGPDTFEPGLVDRRLDDDAIGLVQIEQALRLQVRLLAESHYDETGFLRHFVRYCVHDFILPLIEANEMPSFAA
jgi:hypothetical protein